MCTAILMNLHVFFLFWKSFYQWMCENNNNNNYKKDNMQKNQWLLCYVLGDYIMIIIETGQFKW